MHVKELVKPMKNLRVVNKPILNVMHVKELVKPMKNLRVVNKPILNVMHVKELVKPMKNLRVVNKPILNVMHVKELVKPMKNLRVVNKPILNVMHVKELVKPMKNKQANSECHARKRACETHEESQSRKQANSECHACKRACETHEESQSRKQANSECHARKRACETHEESQSRKQANSECHARKRACETHEESQSRKQANSECHERKRAHETREQSQSRKKANSKRQASSRLCETSEQSQNRKKADLEHHAHQQSSSQNIIDSFLAKTKQGPDYVCKSCHRLLYRQSVIVFKLHKYSKVCSELLSDVFRPEYLYKSKDSKEWICNTCHVALSHGKMPTQAVANGLSLNHIPHELSCLNPLEVRLLSLRSPFMKMVALPSGKQRCIHGPAVNVPYKLDNVCTILPRLPSQSELVALKLKRKLAYKGHYMFDYVTPEKVLNALRWLKIHNPLYSDVTIDEEWLLHAELDDHDLIASMTGRTESMNVECTYTETTESNDACISVTTTNIACETDTNIESETTTNSKSEIELSSELFNCSNKHDIDPIVNPTVSISQSDNSVNEFTTAKYNLEEYASDNQFIVHDVPGDGDCLYHAVLYQFKEKNIDSITAQDLRERVGTYLEEHKDTYMPFVASPISSESVLNCDTEIPNIVDASISSVADPDIRSALVYARYVDRVRSGSWGDHVVVAAIANMFHVTINVVQATQSGCTLSITGPVNDTSNCEINLGLIMQYHFVGLDKQVMHIDNNSINHCTCIPSNQSSSHICNSDSVSMSHGEQVNQHSVCDMITNDVPTTSDSSDINNACFPNDIDHTAQTFEDSAMEEGDEHTRQITGGPLASVMSVENPETFNEVVCVAPAEGQKPMSIMTDSTFEAMSNPDKFPMSSGCFASERPKRITYRKYFNQRLLDVDGRFAKDTDYLLPNTLLKPSKS